MNLIESGITKKSSRSSLRVYLLKRIHRREIWQKFVAKKPGEKDSMICGIAYCDDGIVICTHGSKDGKLSFYEQIMEVLSDPNLSGRDIVIHCCHADKISEKYPDLKKYIIEPEFGDDRYIYSPLDEKIIRLSLTDYISIELF